MKKYCFSVQRLKFLGRIVAPSGIAMDLDKTKAID